jgi:hypothetical protein
MTVTDAQAGGQRPAIDYTDKDYASLRQAMIDLATYRLPEWTDRSPADLGVLMIDLFAYLGDVISYYQDRLASEAFLDTAVERRSVMHLLRLIGYELAGPSAAAAELDLVFAAPAQGQPSTVRIPTRAQFAAAPPAGGGAGGAGGGAGAAISGPPPTFEYLGPDLDVDLTGAAGSRATVRPDGSLLVARLPVRHSRSVVGEVLGSTTGEPNQRFALDAAPVVLDTLVVTVDEGAGPVTWTRRANLAYHSDSDGQVVLSGALSRDYMVELDEAGTVWVVFGDGVYGRRPPPGSANLRAAYSVGGGAVGNVPTGAISVPRTTLAGLVSVTNPLPSAGGADAEPIERAVRFGPLAFRSGDRAVTLKDYHALTLQAGGVAKVRARSTGWNRVDLFVAPEGPECVPSPPELKQRLVAYFEDRRMVGTSVRILDPTCIPIDISVQVVPEHHHDPDTVRAQALAATRAVVAFERVDFARPLYLSKVYEAVEALEGVRAATVTRFRRQDQRVPRSFLKKRGVLRDAGLGAVDDLVVRAFEGAIAVEGKIEIGEVELPTPGTIVVDLRFENA